MDRAGLGSACDSGAACQSGHCVDGVCCNEACPGVCRSCALPGAAGTCRAVPGGLAPPRGGCPVETRSCGTTGTCDGAGACAKVSPGTLCGQAMCQGNDLLPAPVCSTANMCTTAGARSCRPYRCDPSGGSCYTRCEDDQQCAAPSRCVAGACLTLDANEAIIPHAANRPEINGQVDQVWSTASPQRLDRLLTGVVSSDADLSATWRALWDERALYLLIDVRDEAIFNDSPLLALFDDSVEIYVDADRSRGTSYDANDFTYHVLAVSNPGSPATRCQGLLCNPVGPSDGVFAHTVETGNGYRIEMAISWANIGVTPKGGARIGIELQVNDDDDGGARESKRSWADPRDVAWQDPSAFGTGLLGTR